MKRIPSLTIVVAVLTVVSLLLSGCIHSSPENRYYLPLESSHPQEGEEIADDVIPTPGGIAYRANVHQAGEENPWPSIESTTVQLHSGKSEIILGYRNEIVTQAGETRNNIFTIKKIDGRFEPDDVTTMKYYTPHEPDGFILTYSVYVGLPGSLKQLKTTFAYSGTFERSFKKTPAGIIWSVVILSPHLIRTLPHNFCGSGCGTSGTTMVGALITSTFAASFSLKGGSIKLLSMINSSGRFIFGYLIPNSFGKSRGSVILPVRTEATAVSGLTR